MSEEDWEALEEELLTVLDSYGISSLLGTDLEALNSRFVTAILKKYLAALEEPDDDEDEDDS